jgi:hypothetical protein
MAQLAVGARSRSNRVFAVSFRRIARAAVEFIEGTGKPKQERSLRLAEMLQGLAPTGLGFSKIVHVRALPLTNITSLAVRGI